MPVYNFKAIEVVPTAKDFVDIVLSKTQRTTPTVVHNGWAISRIRQFYMRKVKYTASSWTDKLTKIMEDFPKVDDIHPFYADLLNVLYDRDHYKLALGQLNTAKNLIQRISQDYVRLLKYGDSLYRCKQLKRAALGRMCTLMKRHGASLAYLEQVRQHMSRLPAIDPNTRTLLLTGFPNVGKSSFMNKVTRADVEVQPYAFTTKSLYVGHMDYKYLRWQVIDTPGLLDRPLEERNTIEMQSITALAHLRAAVLYIVDISEQCGFTIKQQAALFDSIKPLFTNKPLLIVANKTDVTPLETLGAEDACTLQNMVQEALKVSHGGQLSEGEQGVLHTMSSLQEQGVMDVRNAACDQLLATRVEQKVHGKRINDVLNRIHVATPKGADLSKRPPCIPPGVEAARAAREAGQRKQTEKDLQEAHGGAGVYNADLRKTYQLEDASWKYDIMPEIWDGHNIIDFVDPDIDAKLEELEREEEQMAADWEAEFGSQMDEDHLTAEEAALLTEIRGRRRQRVEEHRRQKSVANNAPVMPRTAVANSTRSTSAMKASLASMGLDPTAAVDRARSRSLSRVGRKRTRSESRGAAAMEGVEGPDTEPPAKRMHSSKSRSMSRGRALSLAEPKKGSGLKDTVQANKAIKLADKAQKKMGKMARIGEADRFIGTKMPKHLFSGKRGIGKTQRR